MSEIEIHAIQFGEAGVVIQYMEIPTDVRVQGQLILSHSIQLHAGHPDYRDDIDLLHRKAVKAVRNALEDFHSSEPYVPESEEDDERGMGE